MWMRENAKLKSLAKGLEVLEFFSLEKPEAGVSEISAELGLNKSNTYDILKTLEAFRYVEQNPKTKEYRLSYETIRRGFIYSNTTAGISQLVPQYLTRTVNELGEVAYYATIRKGKALYLGQCIPHQGTLLSTDFGNVTGFMAPLYCTGIGKALLAFQKDEFIAGVLACGLERFTDTTIVDESRMWEEIRKIRAQGYAVDNMEHVYGVKCVGVPVLNAVGEAEMAISVHGSSIRFGAKRIPVIAEKLKHCATQIAKATGINPI